MNRGAPVYAQTFPAHVRWFLIFLGLLIAGLVFLMARPAAQDVPQTPPAATATLK